MSFKRDLIIKSRFSVIRSGVGTRGNTPGDFVLRYMARDDATETLTPVTKMRIDNFITRYMARDGATEQAYSLKDLSKDFKDAQGLGGRAFGKAGRRYLGSVSLSDEEIRAMSKDIQHAFNAGHTVLESVISFDGHYLQRNNLADKNVKLDKKGHAFTKGAFRGKVDQMKLRLAIMHGLNKMADRRINGHHRYDDFEYVGVIQVDTKQVHCHLAMVDKGIGKLIYTKAGIEQKGCMSKKDMMTLRRGIHACVDSYKPIKELSSRITHDRENVRSYVRRYTQKAIEKSNIAQILLTVLPRDKSLWRAKSNNSQMRVANNIARFYVDQILRQPKSGYDKAIGRVQEYALKRQKQENLSNEQYQKLVTNGQDQIYDRCINSVYKVLRDVPERNKKTHTDLMDSMATSLEILQKENEKANRNEILDFAFHLRTYGKRLKTHRKKAVQYRKLTQDYEDKQNKGLTNPDSLVLNNFYKIETDYHNKMMVKYQHLLPVISRSQIWIKWQKRLQKQFERLRKMKQMLSDNILRNKHGRDAEKYGYKRYQLDGGETASDNPFVFQKRIESQQDSYVDNLTQFEEYLLMDDRSLKFGEDNRPIGKRGVPYKFGEIKALDLHDVANDFPEVKASQNNINNFVNEANNRYDAYEQAAKYLVSTKQFNVLADLDTDDIKKMHDTAQALMKKQDKEKAKSVAKSKRLSIPQVKKQVSRDHKTANEMIKRHYTVSADNQITQILQKEIEQTLDGFDDNLDQRNSKTLQDITD